MIINRGETVKSYFEILKTRTSKEYPKYFYKIEYPVTKEIIVLGYADNPKEFRLVCEEYKGRLVQIDEEEYARLILKEIQDGGS